MATVTYHQELDPSTPGTITFDGVEETAMSGPPNNGRLDNVGDFVFADFGDHRVECIRTSENTMTIRIILNANAESAGYYYNEPDVFEKVVENVPIAFE